MTWMAPKINKVVLAPNAIHAEAVIKFIVYKCLSAETLADNDWPLVEMFRN